MLAVTALISINLIHAFFKRQNLFTAAKIFHQYSIALKNLPQVCPRLHIVTDIVRKVLIPVHS